MALPLKQQRFVDEYLIDLNAKQAAIRAGYSAKTAESQGSRLLSYAKVRLAIADGQKLLQQRTEVTADWVIERLRSEATLKGKGASAAARVSALKVLAQHLGMLIDKHELSGLGGAPIRLCVVEDEAWYANNAHERANGVNRLAESAPPSNNGHH